ncbi:MAG: hypothetical protein MUO64_08650 [Anaerolineales bacterium]|nr:hypothetical protein [Anaerolineales bacterium]
MRIARSAETEAWQSGASSARASKSRRERWSRCRAAWVRVRTCLGRALLQIGPGLPGR